MLDDYGKVLEVRKQRPQDQGLSETSAGSPARRASPSSSGSSASYRKTRKASSPSSSVCFSSRGCRVGGACHRRQLALESGVESEDLEVPLSVHTHAGTLEEHYALVDCRRKRIVFRIPGEDEFSHPLPRNLAGKLVISAMKAMRMAFVAQLSLRSSVLDEVIEQQKADPRLLEQELGVNALTARFPVRIQRSCRPLLERPETAAKFV
ncbi:hypothetical protein Taro_010366 [Colocasia esculenta]|uniref:Uncharacterized protein n=1 Tax=Colocasia esculenta TaxID=4460 RepID=A0A843U7E9_COLES|nr:hypothetical protein [Colocasia esculenta]